MEYGSGAPSRDPVTGLLDRQGFWNSIASRPETWLPAWRIGVAFIDIELFDRFNDARGRATGDAALRLVARTIPCRSPYEWASRYGGDEFAVLLALHDRSEALGWANTTRDRIVNATAEEFSTGIDVRVGIAVGKPGWWPTDIYSDAILPADAALGQAMRTNPPQRIVVQDLDRDD
jgi:diguanylate cyclase (GGDEF)-like protein